MPFLLYCHLLFLHQQYSIRTSPFTVNFSAFIFQCERHGGGVLLGVRSMHDNGFADIIIMIMNEWFLLPVLIICLFLSFSLFLFTSLSLIFLIYPYLDRIIIIYPYLDCISFYFSFLIPVVWGAWSWGGTAIHHE